MDPIQSVTNMPPMMKAQL